MARRVSTGSKIFKAVGPLAKAFDATRPEAGKVVENGVEIAENLRLLALRLRRIGRRTSMRMLSAALKFTTPIDIEELIDDMVDSALTVSRLVRNAGVIPMYSLKLQHLKKEKDLSELIDNIESARDTIEQMEFDRIEMIYSIDLINAAESIVRGISKAKSMSITEKEAIIRKVRTSAITQRLSGFTKKIKGDTADETEVKEERQEMDQIATSEQDMTSLLASIKKDWPAMRKSVDDFRRKLHPISVDLNKILGIKTSIWFETEKELP